MSIYNSTTLGLATNVTTGMTMFNIDWLPNLLLAVVTMIAITRDMEKWKILFIFTTLGWHTIGVETHLMILIIASILFVVNTYTTQLLGKVLGTERIKGLSNVARVTSLKFQKEAKDEFDR